jgi:hypothetical protein
VTQITRRPLLHGSRLATDTTTLYGLARFLGSPGRLAYPSLHNFGNSQRARPLIERYPKLLALEPFLEGHSVRGRDHKRYGLHMQPPKPHGRVISRRLLAVRIPAL